MTTSKTSKFQQSKSAKRFAATAYVALTTLTSTHIAKADTIELLNGDSLTGTISGMSKDGAKMNSDLSLKPLEISASAIKKISFTSDHNSSKSHSERLTLINGDILPCRVISLNDTDLKINTWYAGDFTIDRKNIHSLRFGLSEERDIYLEGNPASQWTTQQGAWTSRDGVYNSSGAGTLAQELDLPAHVRFTFDLAWKDSPNFVFRFCAESDAANTKQDTYELVFNSEGMQLKRYQGREENAPLDNIDKKPHEFTNKKVNIDLRLNNTDGAISLYIDGQKAGTYFDDFETARGKYIIFNNRSSSTNACIISNIRVTQWKDSRHVANIAPSSDDTLIDSQGDRISGQIKQISMGANNKRFIELHKEHSTKPIMVPDYRASILYFAENEDQKKPDQSVFVAKLSNQGNIQLENPKMENNKLLTHHPILGQCNLDPKVISSIVQNKKASDK